MTTLSMAVSVAVVMLDRIRSGPAQERRHKLYVDFSLFGVGFLSQPSEPALEVITTAPRVTCLTFEILTKKWSAYH